MAAARATSRRDRTFESSLIRYSGKGGWTFAPVPDGHAPPVTRGWGRTPVTAFVDGQRFETSVWRGKDGVTLLPLPKHLRRNKGAGDVVRVRLVRREDAP